MGGKFINTRNFDSPDGENCLPKTVHTAKVFGALGAYVSLYDIIGLSNPVGIMATLGRVATFAFPAAGAGGVYAATSCILGNIRGKDSPVNHAIGGAAAGAILSTQFKATKWGFVAIFGLAGLCSLIKGAKMDGLALVPKETPIRAGFMNSYKFSLAGNRPECKPPTDY